MFQAERMDGTLGKRIPADAEGRFEIKALPAGRRYGVSVSAKGYSRVSRFLDQDAERRRIELEPCVLLWPTSASPAWCSTPMTSPSPTLAFSVTAKGNPT